MHAFHDTVLTQKAHCTMENDAEGWIVILRRKPDVLQQINFTRTWDEYVHGFGDLNTEFWYGLRNIHCLTSKQQVDLDLFIKLPNGTSFSCTYDHFKVDSPEKKYTLHIGKAEGRGCSYFVDPMRNINGTHFSTYDSDNDNYSSRNCATHTSYGNGGGWWYSASNCGSRPFTRNPQPYINFRHNGDLISINDIEMKLRPKQCS